MTGNQRFACCAVFVLCVGIWSEPAHAQSDDNPFGNPIVQRSETPRRSDPRPLRGQGPFELLGQPAPTPAPAQPATAPPGALRPAAAPPVAGQQAVEGACQCLGERSDAAARIRKALANPLVEPLGLSYDGTALEEVVNELSARYNIPIQLDKRELEDAGAGPADQVRINVHGISLRSALNQMLRQLNLTYIIQDEVLLITTPAAAEAQLVVCLYDVRDLVAGPGREFDFENLIGTIRACLGPSTWVDNGGTGSMQAMQPGLLAVSQTAVVHEQIGEMLAAVRQLVRRAPPVAGANLPPAAERIVTRHYWLQVEKPADPDAFQKQLRDLILTLVPDPACIGTLPDGQPVLISVLPDRVVVRHRESVQRQVEAVLSDIGMLTPSQPDGNKIGRGPAGGRLGSGGGIFQPQPVDD